MEIIAIVFGSVGAYVAISLFFFYNPNMLYKKHRDTVMSKVKNMAHRGGCIEAPENTMDAFKKCLENGSEMLEMDLHITKDGVPVVFHDDSLLRVTGVNELVRNLNYSELPTSFRPNLPVPFPQFTGQTIDTTSYDTHIPTLEEVFQAFPSIPVNLDLKDPSMELLDATHDLIVKYDRRHLVVWGGFRPSTCDACYKKDPSIALLFSYRTVLKTLILHYTGLLPLFPIRESFLEIPVFTKTTLKNLTLNSKHSNKVKLAYWIQQHVLLSKRMLRHLNQRGITVMAWVENSREEFDHCFNSGINGIITDTPSDLREYLEDRSESESD